MRVLIHDLSEEEVKKCEEAKKKDTIVITKTNDPVKCVGCFGCWVKNPGECIMKDGYQHMGEYLGNCEEFVIISECRYGEFSPYIKNIIDRSISVCQPYFVKREGKMHHKLRYQNHPKLFVYYYGEDLPEEEKEILKNRVAALAINMGAEVKKVTPLEGK